MSDNLKDKLKKIPFKTWVISICYFLFIYGLYRLADLLSRVTGTIDGAWCPKIPAIDDVFPLVPAFCVIYLFSFVFWICGFAAVSLTEKKNFRKYIIGFTAACAVGFAVFAIWPSYMDRTAEGVCDAVAPPGFFNFIMRHILYMDGQGKAFDLFPSYHCLMSLYTYLGVRRQPEISKGYKVYCLIMTGLICASCLLIKQHYFIDVIGGLALALIVYLIIEKTERS